MMSWEVRFVKDMKVENGKRLWLVAWAGADDDLSPDCRGVGRCRALSGHCRATVGPLSGHCRLDRPDTDVECRGLLSGAVGGSLTVTMCVHCRAVSGLSDLSGLSGCRVLSGTVGCQAKHMSVSSTEHHSSTVSHRRCLPGPTAQH